MKRRKIESYDEGYSRGNIVKRVAAGASALLLCGSLTACHRIQKEQDDTIMGNMVYSADDYDPDISSGDELTLDGEERYYPVEDDVSSESYTGDLSVESSDGD